MDVFQVLRHDVLSLSASSVFREANVFNVVCSMEVHPVVELVCNVLVDVENPIEEGHISSWNWPICFQVHAAEGFSYCAGRDEKFEYRRKRIANKLLLVRCSSPWALRGRDGGEACDRTRELKGVGEGNSFCVPRGRKHAIGLLKHHMVDEEE